MAQSVLHSMPFYFWSTVVCPMREQKSAQKRFGMYDQSHADLLI